jgi:hypothetical protein
MSDREIKKSLQASQEPVLIESQFYEESDEELTIAEKMILQSNMENEALDLLDLLRQFIEKHSYDLLENLNLGILVHSLYEKYERVI